MSRTQAERRAGMPSKGSLFKSWAGTKLLNMKCGWIDGPEDYGTDVCWACGWMRETQRCHIVAVCDGGSNHWSNIVLMCHHCHTQSEGLSERKWWDWFWRMGMKTSLIRDTAGHTDIDWLALK